MANRLHKTVTLKYQGTATHTHTHTHTTGPTAPNTDTIYTCVKISTISGPLCRYLTGPRVLRAHLRSPLLGLYSDKRNQGRNVYEVHNPKKQKRGELNVEKAVQISISNSHPVPRMNMHVRCTAYDVYTLTCAFVRPNLS